MSPTQAVSQTPPGQGASSRLWLAGVPLLGLVFRTLLEPSSVLAIGDLAFFHLPLRTLLAEAAAQGFPWWNAALHGGQPILSNPNYAAFYPPTWLTFVLPPAAAIQAVLLLHVAWGYAGAWRLARHLGCRPRAALLAALAFTCGGVFVSSATLLTLFCGLAWTPWILLWAGRALEAGSDRWRRDAALAAAGIAAQLLAGEPVNCILSGVALLGLGIDSLVAGRRTVHRLAAALALCLLLGAAQLVPTAGRLAASPRGGGIERAAATERSMPPARLLEWAVAHPLGDPMRIDDELFFGQSIHDKGFPYLISIYPGFLIAILALGSLARRGVRWRWTWIVMVGGGVLLALGRHDPLYEPILGALPLFDQIRYPEKLLLLATAALPFAAALGWEARRRPAADSARGRLDMALVLAVVATAGVAGMVLLLALLPEAAVWLATTLRTTPLPAAAEAGLISWMRTDLLISLLTAAAGTVLLFLVGSGSRGPGSGGSASGGSASGGGAAARRRRLEVALLLLVAFDLGRNDWNLLPVAPLEAISRPPLALAGHPPDGRLFTDFMFSLDAQIPLRYDGPGPLSFWNGVETLEPYLATLWGYSYALHHDYDLMLTEPARLALDAFAADWDSPELALRFAGAWDVGTLAIQRPVQEVLLDRLEGRPGPRVRIDPSPYRLPEVRLLNRVRLFASQTDALAGARAAGYRLAQAGYWVEVAPGEEPPGGWALDARTSDDEAPDPAATLSVVDSGWSRLVLETRSNSALSVQVARTWDAGWACRIAGRETAIHRTASGQMGLRVPAGARTIELRYQDPLVPVGVMLSLAGLAVSAWSWRRRPEIGSSDAQTS